MAETAAAPSATRPGSAAAIDRGTSERLHDAAAALFGTRGYGATSVRDIARAGGVSAGVIYNHFGSKEGLLHAIVAGWHEGLLAALLEAERLEPGFAALVRAFGRHVVERPALALAAERHLVHLEPGHLAQVATLRDGILATLERGLLAAVPPSSPLAGAGPLGARRVVTTLANMLTGLAEARPAALVDLDALVELHARLACAMLRA